MATSRRRRCRSALSPMAIGTWGRGGSIVQVLTPGPATPAPEKAASAPPAALAPDSPPAPKLRPAPTPYEAHHRPTKSQTSPPPPDYAPPPPPKPKPEPKLEVSYFSSLASDFD